MEVITASVTSSSKDDLTGTKRSPQSIALFVAMVATGLALGGWLSHLYELPNKIDHEQHAQMLQQKFGIDPGKLAEKAIEKELH